MSSVIQAKQTETGPEQAASGAIEITYRDLLRTGPDTLAGRYLRQYWQPVFRAEDLKAGHTKPIKIMSEDFTLYRGADGKARVVGDRCAHRGAKMSNGSVEGSSLRCVYHGWLYDESGQCVEQPAEPKPFCAKAKIRAYPTKEYLGLIFVFFGEGEPPELPRLREYEDNGYIQSVLAAEWPHNYFTQIENTLDYAHTAFLHWQFNSNIPKEYVAEETPYGLRTFTPGLRDLAIHEIGHLHMPNAQEYMTVPVAGEKTGYFMRGWRVPRDDHSYIRFDIQVFPLQGQEAEEFKVRQAARGSKRLSQPIAELAREFLDGRRELSELKDRTDIGFNDLTRLQDCVVLMGLEPMADREHRDQLGQSDMGIAAARRLWRRELHALAAGKPLTQWKRPDYFFKEEVSS